MHDVHTIWSTIHHNHIVCTSCINKWPIDQINEVEDNGQTNEGLTPNTQVSEDWFHIPDWSSNVDIDQINEENNQISEWGTIQPPNNQDNEDCSWKSETLNETDRNDDEEWLKPNPQVVFVEAT